MKISNHRFMWISIAFAACIFGADAAHSHDHRNNNNDNDNSSSRISETKTTRDLSELIHEQNRFVLFNSRRLAGECLPVCEPDRVTINGNAQLSPSLAPTRFPEQRPVTGLQTLGSNGGDSTSTTTFEGAPSQRPSGLPSAATSFPLDELESLPNNNNNDGSPTYAPTYLVEDIAIAAAPVQVSAAAMTPPPTDGNGNGCVRIPQSELGPGLQETTDQNCSQCSSSHPGGPISGWPCNADPLVCQGQCLFQRVRIPQQ